MPILATGDIDVIGNDTAGALINILTGPMDSTRVRFVRPDVYIVGMATHKGRVGIQWNDEPIATGWGTAWPIDFAANPNEFATTNGWTYGAITVDLYSGSFGTPKLYVRFVWLGLNTSGSATTGAQLRTKLHLKPLKTQTLAGGPQRVHSKGDSSWVVHLVSDPIPAERVAELRGTIGMDASTGTVTGKLTLQGANKPDVAADWTDIGDISGTTITGNGTNYASTFAAFAVNKDHVRIVAKVQNTSGSEIEAFQLSWRVDIREP